MMGKNITPKLTNDIEKRADKDLEEAREMERLRELEEYRKQAMDQFFQDGSCTGGNLQE
jgi:hypothetical protein